MLHTFEREQLTTSEIYNLCKTSVIDLEAPYQRDVVWPDCKSEFYINSLYLGYACTPLIFGSAKSTKICIDGKQRITAIRNFIEGKIPIKLDDEKLYYKKNKSGKLMSDEQIEKFDDIQLEIINYSGLSYTDQIELFNRIQNGIALTSENLSLSIFNEETVAIFKKYCKTNSKIFGRYANDSKGEHYQLVANIIFIVGTNRLQDITQAATLKYFTKLTATELEKNLTTATDLIKKTYEKVLKSNPNLVKRNIQFATVKFIIDTEEVDLDKLAKVLKNIVIKNSSTTKEQLSDIYEIISEEYEKPTEIAVVKKKKETITAAKKKSLWNKWIGKTKGETLCFCCKDCLITQLGFVAGHVVAESKGGDLSLNNLRPICSGCNSSMKTTDMREFMEKNSFGELLDKKTDMNKLYRQYKKQEANEETSDEE